jgi:accessory gene regulator B
MITDIASEKRNGINISPYERSLINYLFVRMRGIIVSLVVVTVVGIIFMDLPECMAFYASIIALRKFSGGYHADTEGKCYFLSSLIVLFTAGLLALQRQSFVVGLCITVAGCIAAIVILLVSPVDCPNRRLSEEKKVKFKNISSRILAVSLLLIIILYFSGNSGIAMGIMFAIIWTAVGIPAGLRNSKGSEQKRCLR